MKHFLLNVFALFIFSLMSCHQEVKAQSDSVRYNGNNSLMSIHSAFEDNLSLRINSNAGKSLRYVKIFDIIGKEVATIDVAGQGYPVQYNLDLSAHRQNIFICNLYSEKGLVESKKFFKGKTY